MKNTRKLFVRCITSASIAVLLIVPQTLAQHVADSLDGIPQKTSAPDTVVAIQRAHFFSRLGDTLAAGLTSRPEPKPLSWKSVAIPAGLITFGTLSVTSDWVDNFNAFGQSFTNNDKDPNERTSVDDYTLAVPTLAVGGLHLAGVHGKNNIVDAAMMATLSHTLAYAGIISPLKRLTAHERPDGSDSLTFPSGHTAAAFVSAEFLRQEYKDVNPWIGAAGYGCAVLTGYLRMYNNKHWLSDVAAGAGVGIISTRITYWLYPKIKNVVLRKIDPKGNAMIFPHYRNGGFGVTAFARF